MGRDNVRTHLPLPDMDSPIHYIVARLEPHRKIPHAFDITAIERVVPTDVRFGDVLEMGPAERSDLIARVSRRRLPQAP
jgi:hypothetical protein